MTARLTPVVGRGHMLRCTNEGRPCACPPAHGLFLEHCLRPHLADLAAHPPRTWHPAGALQLREPRCPPLSAPPPPSFVCVGHRSPLSPPRARPTHRARCTCVCRLPPAVRPVSLAEPPAHPLAWRFSVPPFRPASNPGVSPGVSTTSPSAASSLLCPHETRRLVVWHPCWQDDEPIGPPRVILL